MRLPPDVIDRVREATDIVAVISEHVQLKRTGKTWKALCPFHKEKTPSFHVNPDRQTYKCFGCDEGGDVIQFLIESEKLSFREAVEVLANKAGIPLPKSSWAGTEEQSVYPVLEWTASWFRRELAGKSGGPARDYLEKRGLDQEVIERFGLGWAPAGWSNLMNAAGTNYPTALLQRAGLVIENDRGGHYDRFRDRVIIPIRSALGRTVGFGARTLGPEEPKYLNSPETEVFNKGKLLYGLSEARESLKQGEEVWVVEGYMDVLALAQAGFDHVVASCGTAFSEDQAKIIRRYVDRAVLVFDGDTAGLRAAWKSAGVFLGEGLEVRIVALPDKHDPDSFVRQQGADAMRDICREAPGVVGFAQEALMGHLEKREDLIKALAYLGAKVDDPIRRRVLLQEAAERFRFDESTLAAETSRLRGAGSSRNAAPPRRSEDTDNLGRLYLAALLTEAMVPDDAVLPEIVIREQKLLPLFRDWLSLRESGEVNPRGRLLESEAHRSLTAEILVGEEVEVPIEDLLTRLRDRVRAARGQELKEAIREAESGGDLDEVERLLRELHSLKEVQ